MMNAPLGLIDGQIRSALEINVSAPDAPLTRPPSPSLGISYSPASQLRATRYGIQHTLGIGDALVVVLLPHLDEDLGNDAHVLPS